MTIIRRMLRSASVLVVDDHPIYRQGLVSALQAGAAGLAVGGAATAGEALAALERDSRHDLLLVDYRLPDRDGLSLIETVRRRWPTVGCALISGVDDSGISVRARQLGCVGCVSKSLDSSALVRAVLLMLSGELCFCGFQPSDAAAAELTERQAEVLQLVSIGCSNKEVARTIGVTERTVKDHLTSIYSRLGVAGRAEAVARAAARGLIALQRGSR
jgi:DNA-binding NarL/FixJ family response regulator